MEQRGSEAPVDLEGETIGEGPPPAEPVKRRRIKKWRRVRRPPPIDLDPEKILNIPGVAKLVLSSITQKTFKCVVGEDVTAEYPWRRIPKEEILDNLEFYEADSEFASIADEVLQYPHHEFLLGYIPSENQDFEEFYICVSELADTTVSQIVENILEQREERLNNSILKTVGSWKPQGSENEVEDLIYKNNRSLLEVEVESQYPVRDTKSRFKLRLAEHAQDGYLELLSKRTTFANLLRKRINMGIQVTPAVAPNVAQTTLGYPKSISTQYEFEFRPLGKLSKEFHNNIKSFVGERMDDIDDSIYVNSFINFYKDDYTSLVRDVSTTRVGGASLINEWSSLYDQNLGIGQVIVGLSWHPMWSGTVAIAYADDGQNLYTKFKPNKDEVLDALYKVGPVQLWSFTDTLTAKLFLEVPRRVTALAFCPTQENILVGGCINGQVLVWDIKDRLRRVEEEDILTPDQQRYRTRMQSLMTWMRNNKDPKIVRTTVVSNLQYSHTSAVTSIRWMSPYREVTKSGQIQEIPEDVDRTSLQFITSSKDGTVLAWDLQAKPSARDGGGRSRRRLRRLKRRPSALVTDVSELKELNRILKPIFKVNVLAPHSSRPLPIASLNMRTTPIIYEEKNPNPNRKPNIVERVHHKAIITRPVHPLINKFIAGTVEGDFLIASWEGFEFNSGEVVNKETCKIENFGKVHDGPVVSLSRSPVYGDLILTVGGKVFAIWRTDFIGKPVIWRRTKTGRYTYGVWNAFRPSAFRMLRNDGCVELWNLNTRSDRYQNISYLSGGSLTGTYTNMLSKEQKIVGMADYTGSLRLFLVSQSLTTDDDESTAKIYELCSREVDRKLKFTKWQQDWVKKNAAWVAAKKARELALRKEREEENKRDQTTQKDKAEHADEHEPKAEEDSFAKAAEQQWKLKEQKRMNAVLLQKKMLDVHVLEKQQLPLKKIAAEQQKLQKKMNQRQNNAKKIFHDTVATLFPDALEKKPPPPPDPYGGGDCMDVKVEHYKSYQELVEECDKFVDERKYVFHFNWFFMRREGMERRKLIDGYYSRSNHKARLVKEKEEAEQEYQFYLKRLQAPPPKPQSLGSIDYGTPGIEDEAEGEGDQ